MIGPNAAIVTLGSDEHALCRRRCSRRASVGGSDHLVRDASPGCFDLGVAERAVLLLPLRDGAEPVSDEKGPSRRGGHPSRHAHALVGRCRNDPFVNVRVNCDCELWRRSSSGAWHNTTTTVGELCAPQRIELRSQLGKGGQLNLSEPQRCLTAGQPVIRTSVNSHERRRSRDIRGMKLTVK